MFDKSTTKYIGKNYLLVLAWSFGFSAAFTLLGIILSNILTRVHLGPTINGYTFYTAPFAIGLFVAIIIQGIQTFYYGFPVSVGTSKTRGQFVFSSLVTNIIITVIISFLITLCVYFELKVKGEGIDLLVEWGIIKSPFINVDTIFESIKFIAGAMMFGALSYRFGWKFWVTMLFLFMFGPFIAAIPFVNDLMLAILSSEFIQSVISFFMNNKLIGVVIEILFYITVVIGFGLVMNPRAKNSN